MNNDIGNTAHNPLRKHALAQWTRPSGRVIRRKKGRIHQETLVVPGAAAPADLAEIYRKLLRLRDEENLDLADALAYGIKLLENKDVTRSPDQSTSRPTIN